jgi:hypothetical protein
MAVLASRLLAPPSLAHSQREFAEGVRLGRSVASSQRELASDARSLACKGSLLRTLGRSPFLSLSLHGTGLTTVVLVPVVPPSRAPFEAV